MPPGKDLAIVMSVFSKALPSMAKSYQSAALQILCTSCKVHSLASELHEEVIVTSQPIAPFDIHTQWGDEVLAWLTKAT